jgi:hypothetical protein
MRLHGGGGGQVELQAGEEFGEQVEVKVGGE